ncbi:hypothetical protein ACEQ8H_003367 [Pleosporales sp. CAS-2024a]
MAPVYQVAVYLFPNADILDFSGPTEIYAYGTPGGGPSPFNITSFAHFDSVGTSSQALTYTPNTTFEQIAPNIHDYDILVIPGADFAVIEALIKSDQGKELFALLRTFVASKPREESGKRILQSVCTGSLLLAAAGILAGRDATTHHFGFEALKKIADEAAGGDSNINVKKARWADAGKTEAGVRIINAGGVSSGIDTSLFVVEELCGKEAADWAAEVAEFGRRSTGWSE